MEQYVIKNQKVLRCGITTGTCATAAAAAAAELLLMQRHADAVSVHTPKGTVISVPVYLSLESEQICEYMVIKDSGDDPDVTNCAEIFVSVEKISEADRPLQHAFCHDGYPNLFLDGGTGIGRVTKEGLEQQTGQAAINMVPRGMIFEAVRKVCDLAKSSEPLLITVRVPKGEELAEHTFNPRLGIVGGISILGTSGIIEPMSEKAIIDTIETQIRQLQVQGEQKLLVTPGNYGKSYTAEYLHLDLRQSIKCSNYIGDTLDLAAAYGMKYFLLVGNVGKLVKLAAGIMNTHSKTADARCEIFAVHTVLCGGSQSMVQEIMTCIHTEEILKLLKQWGILQEVMDSICRKISEYLRLRSGRKMQAGAILFSETYGFLGQTHNAKALLREYQ